MLSPERLTSSRLKRWQIKAMASMITIQAPDATADMEEAVRVALAVFRTVDATCSRFDRNSALTRANARPRRWHRAPPTLFSAVAEAYQGHVATKGAFDPRVHDALVGLGYDRSFSQGIGPLAEPPDTGVEPGPWQPRFFRPFRLVHLDDRRIDLGGVGKGLAVRWAADILRAAGSHFLIDAGGDCYAAGRAETAAAWRIGVESPTGEGGPLAVLEVRDLAVATSSTRVRNWRHGDQSLHHLIDPCTGRPGGGSLASVTIVHPDPARAEVWSKAAFLAGENHIAALADDHELPALWVDRTGTVGTSEAIRSFLIWERT
jgi:thiamine biosynthesis lipoprotein